MLVYFTDFENMSGDFNIYEYGEEQCNSGYGFGPYIRQTYFLHYVYSGKGVFRAEGREYQLRAGQMFLILPGQLTYYEADKNDPWFYRWISFDGGLCETMLHSAGLSIESPVLADNALGSAGKAIEKIVSGGAVSHARLMSGFWDFADSLPQSKTSAPDRRIRRARAYIHSHYMEQLSVGEIAAAVNIDRCYLSRLFKEYEGIPPQEYLIRYRMRIAQSLLLDTDYDIAAVARLVGYEDVLNFSKRFKSRFGISPFKWRRQKRSMTEELMSHKDSFF